MKVLKREVYSLRAEAGLDGGDDKKAAQLALESLSSREIDLLAWNIGYASSHFPELAKAARWSAEDASNYVSDCLGESLEKILKTGESIAADKNRETVPRVPYVVWLEDQFHKSELRECAANEPIPKEAWV